MHSDLLIIGLSAQEITHESLSYLSPITTKSCSNSQVNNLLAQSIGVSVTPGVPPVCTLATFFKQKSLRLWLVRVSANSSNVASLRYNYHWSLFKRGQVKALTTNLDFVLPFLPINYGKKWRIAY